MKYDLDWHMWNHLRLPFLKSNSENPFQKTPCPTHGRFVLNFFLPVKEIAHNLYLTEEKPEKGC